MAIRSYLQRGGVIHMQFRLHPIRLLLRPYHYLFPYFFAFYFLFFVSFVDPNIFLVLIRFNTISHLPTVVVFHS